MNKKIVNGIIIVFIIIIVMIGFAYIHNSRKWTRSKVVELMKKTENYNNFEITYNNGEKVLYRNNVLLQKNAEITIWTNYETKEKISIIQNEQYPNGKVIVENNVENDYEGLRYYLKYINNNTYHYKYIDEEEYNQKECVIIELENKNENVCIKLYIDKANGTTVKAEYYKINENERTLEISNEYNIKLDQVTNNDIIKPDLTKYNDIEKK